MFRRRQRQFRRFVRRVKVAVARGSATRVAVALSRQLNEGSAFGAAVRAVTPLLCEEALREALARFEGGPAALLIVDLRDALARLLTDSGACLGRRHPRGGDWLPRRLRELAGEVRGDDVVQRLVNCVLAEAGLYSEAQLLDLERLDPGDLAAELSAVLGRMVSTRLSAQQAAHTLGTLGASYEFIDRLAKA